MVFDCGRPITVFSLDATFQVLAGPDHVRRLESRRGEPARRLAGLLRPFSRRYKARFGPDHIPLHDPCTVVWLLRPELFETQAVPVAVETAGKHTLGATVVDWWGMTGAPANADWTTKADGEAVLDFLIERIGLL